MKKYQVSHEIPDGFFVKGKEYTHRGMREPNKQFNRFLSLVEFAVNNPNEHTLFVGKRTLESIEEMAKIVKIKWFIYVDSGYDMDRKSFVGKFKVLGVIK